MDLNPSFKNRLSHSLEKRRDECLLRSIPEPRDIRINLSSNDYLNLRMHPDVIQAGAHAASIYGSGSGASPLLSGFCPLHQQLLDSLKHWTGKPCGLLFNTGFMANQALIHHLPGPRDFVLADKQVHHSFQQALAHSRTKFARFQHNDLDHLETLLRKNRDHHETLFVATESLYSMDGDSPDLPGIAELKRRYGFVWILDEAHALGLYGEQGQGLAQEAGVLPDVDILVGTLGKTLASVGAFVLTDAAVIVDYLTNYAGELIYSTFLPPSAAGTALAALDRVQVSREAALDLKDRSKKFRCLLADSGHKTMEGDSPIVPLILENPEIVLSAHTALLERGILAGAVRPPTVPAGSSRLRLSLHAGLQEQDLLETLEIINQCRVT